MRKNKQKYSGQHLYNEVMVDIENVKKKKNESTYSICGAGLVEHTRINSSGKQVVGSSDCMNITRQVQVELIHGDDLRVPSSSCTTLDTKSGTLRWLTDTTKCNLVQMRSKGLNESNNSGRFALAERGGCDTRHDHVATVLAVF